MIYVYKKDANESVFAIDQTTGQVEETKDSTISPAAEFTLDGADGELSYDQDAAIRDIEFIVNDRGYLAVESFTRAIAEKLQYSGTFLDIPFVTITVKSSAPIVWEIGDYIVWDYDGNKYILRDLPNTVKQSSVGTYGEAFVYENVKFVSELSLTKNVSFLDVVAPENNIHFTALPVFSFYGKVSDLVGRFNANLSRLYDNWLVKEADLGGTGDVYESMQEYFNIDIDNNNCWGTLTLFFSLWGVGYIYYYDEATAKHTIEVGAVSQSTGDFAYGQGNGLRIIAKNITNEDAVITRLRAYGSDKNLPSRYYNSISVSGDPLIGEMQYVPNLMIPYTEWGTTDGVPDVLKAYIDCNDADVDPTDTSFAKYGIRELSMYFDGTNDNEDIHPTIENITVGELKSVITAYTGTEVYLTPSAEYGDSERLDVIKVGDTISDDGNVNTKTQYTEVVSYAGDSGVEGDRGVEEGGMQTDARIMRFALEPIFTGTIDTKGEYEARFGEQAITLVSTNVTITSATVRLWLVKNGQKSYPAKSLTGVAITNGLSFDFENFMFDAEADGDTYGIVVDAEVVYTSEPHYASIVWAIGAGDITYYFKKYIIENTFKITLKQIGFDVVKYAATTGQNATISMTSGDCAGREFTIRSSLMVGDSWELTCVRQTDGSLTQWFPNNVFHIAADDSFVLLNLSMPEIFIGIAAARLYVAACDALVVLKEQQYIYEPQIDNVYMALNPEVIKEGMMMPVADTDLGIDDSIIINSLTITENEGEVRQFEVVLREKGDTGIGSYIGSVAKGEALKATRRIVNASTRKTQSTESLFNVYAVELARRNTIRQTQLEELLFDSEGYFDGTNIRPNSIDTLYLSVGAKATDFWLNNTVIEPNFEGDKNVLSVSAGQLIHLRLQVAGVGHTWVIATPLLAEALVSETAYYLYAKCSKTALTGEWLLSDEQLMVEPSPADGYYYFLVGILFNVLESPTGIFARDYDFTYGMTYINGRTITTGRIRSIDGYNYFDLDLNKFRLGDANSSIDWNVTTAATLTLRGALVQSPSGTTFPIKTFRGVYSTAVAYYKGDEVTYGGESWLYISATSTTGTTPVEGAYWTKSAAKGASGTTGGTVTLVPSKQVFNYSAAGVLTDTGAWFIFANVFNIAGTLYYEWIINGTSIANDVHYAYGLVPPESIANMPVTYKVNVRVGSTGGTVVATDMVTVYGVKPGTNGDNGIDGYTVILSNEAHTLPAASDGTVSVFTGSGTDILVFSGIDAVAYGASGANTFSVSATPTYGITLGAASTISTYTRRYADITAMSVDSGTVTFTITVRDAAATEFVITKVQSISKSKAGTDGNDGQQGPAPLYRGLYDGGAVYYGTSIRVDIVKYNAGAGDSYYVAKPSVGGGFNQLPTNTAYWDSFGASFSSVATELLFAEKALVENLAVRYYEGVAVGNGVLSGTAAVVNYADVYVKRKDSITLASGTIGGVASIGCNGAFTQMFYHDDGLTATAAAFVAAKSAFFLTVNVNLTSSGAVVYFEHTTNNMNFSYAADIAAATNAYQGGVNINGNDIWDDATNTDSGTVCINRKGYDGGWSKYRRLYVFDGRGTYLLRVEGSATGGAINTHATAVVLNGDFFEFAGTEMYMPNIPTSDNGLASGVVYRDMDGFLRIV